MAAPVKPKLFDVVAARGGMILYVIDEALPMDRANKIRDAFNSGARGSGRLAVVVRYPVSKAIRRDRPKLLSA